MQVLRGLNIVLYAHPTGNKDEHKKQYNLYAVTVRTEEGVLEVQYWWRFEEGVMEVVVRFLKAGRSCLLFVSCHHVYIQFVSTAFACF